MKRALAAIAAGFAVACGGDSTGPISAGNSAFILVRANSRPLPLATVNQRGDSTRIWYGALTLNADGTYAREQRDSTRQPTGSIANIQSFDYGTWTVRGDSVFLASTLSVAQYPPGRGTKSETSARVLIGSIEYEFAKQ